MRLTIALFVLLLPAWGAGCGSGGPSAADDQAFMSSLCELMESCCMKNGETNLNPSSCKDQLQILGFSHDATLHAACLAELRQLGADGNCFWDVGNLDDPCVRIFHEPGGTSPPPSPGPHR